MRGMRMRKPQGWEGLSVLICLGALSLPSCGGTGSAGVAEATATGGALKVTLGPLSGEAQVVYSGTLQARGGKAPYTWKITAGVLPNGLELNPSQGVIEGTPTDPGDYEFTLRAEDSSKPSPHTSSQDFKLTISPALQVATTALCATFLGKPYEAKLAAWGGFAPYTWSITSGSLPPGVTLDDRTGSISGTPSSGGEFSVTVQVSDSLNPSAAVSAREFKVSIFGIRLDQYGGLADAPVPGGATGFFRVAKVGDRWTLVTPTGNAFFLLGVYNVSGDTHVDELGGTYDARVIAKYGDRDINWGPQQVRRLRSWGFNAIGPYSIRWVEPTDSIEDWPGDHTQPEKVPMVGILNPSLYSLRNLNNWASGAVKDIVYGTDSHFSGYRASFPDVFDPRFEQFMDNQLKEAVGPDGSRNSPWLIGWMVDDTDYLNGFGAGPDFTTLPEAGKNNRHLGWISLITAPTQANNSVQNVTYADTELYTKYALRDFLRERYETISALNRAWGSEYSSFDSDGGWPDGNGLLDENGRHTLWVGTDSVYLTDANPTVKKDLDDFLFVLADKYFRVCRDRVKANSPNTLYFGPTVVGSWGTPARAQVLEAAARYVDVLNTNIDVTDQPRLDFVIQHLGDKPIAYWEGQAANADSALWRYPCSTCSSDQSARARYYEARVDAYFNARASSTGSRPSVGFIWWEFHDNYGEKTNWGLVSLSDNAYDGKEATVSGGRPGVQGSGHCRDAWGHPCGAEERDFGDFLSGVRNTNIEVLRHLLATLTAH
jgi:hypothetical protein